MRLTVFDLGEGLIKTGGKVGFYLSCVLGLGKWAGVVRVLCLDLVNG